MTYQQAECYKYDHVRNQHVVGPVEKLIGTKIPRVVRVR